MSEQMVQWVFSGVGITIILSIFGVIRLFFGLLPFPLFKVIDEEKTLLSSNVLFLRKVFMEIGFVLSIPLISIAITDIKYSEHSLSSNFPYLVPSAIPKSGLIIISIMFIAILVMLILIRNSERIRTHLFKEVRKEMDKKTLISFLKFFFYLFVFIYGYVFSSLYLFGYAINLVVYFLKNSYSVNADNPIEALIKLPPVMPVGVIVLFSIFYGTLYLIYRLVINQIFVVGRLATKNQIQANITLINGKVFTEKYILRPSIDGNILLGEKPTIVESVDKILLPKQSILYIEFKRIHYSFGEEVKTKNNDEVKKDETNKVKKNTKNTFRTKKR